MAAAMKFEMVGAKMKPLAGNESSAVPKSCCGRGCHPGAPPLRLGQEEEEVEEARVFQPFFLPLPIPPPPPPPSPLVNTHATHSYPVTANNKIREGGGFK